MFDLIRELWQLLKTRKKFWLTPIILALVLLGGLIVFTSGSVLAPMMYTIF